MACLQKLYQSLKKQSCKEFEWIVIDDGSTDNAFEILCRYAKEENSFPVHVYTQENKGKHRSINRAVSLAKGRYFLILDNDDFLISSAVEKIRSWCSEIEDLSNYDSFAGVAGLKMLSDFRVVGGCGNGEKFVEATNLQRARYKLKGDKAEIYKTEILRQFPFKEFEGENFLTEETVWNKIAEAGYKIRWYKEAVYVCEYREDGLTKNSENILLKNFEGYTYSVKECIRLQSLANKVVGIGKYALRAEKKGISNKEAARRLSVPAAFVYVSKKAVEIYNFLKSKGLKKYS